MSPDRLTDMFRHVGLFLCTLALPTLAAADSMDSSRVVQLQELQDLILDERFEAAEAEALSMQRQRPSSPLTTLFRAAVYMGEMTAREEKLYDEQFRSLVDSTIALADSALLSAQDREAAWLYLWRGHAQAYRAMWEARFGSFIAAIKFGIGAKDDYKEGLDHDSTLYDLYVGLGSFHYWKSARAGILRWLGLFSDDKQLGVDELRLAADSAIVFGRAAREALIWIWLDQGEYDSVVVTASGAAERYPEGTIFLWPLARAYMEKHHYRQALRVYRNIRERLAEDPGNYYNLIECDYQIARCHEGLRQTDRAVTVARKVRDYLEDVDNRVRGRQRRTIAYLRRLARL